MAVPLTVQLFDAFLGEAEGIHSVILPDVFSSSGSKNLWLDKYGRTKRILGYAKRNETAVTTDTGGSATRMRGLFPYRASASGVFTRVLVGIFDDGANEYEIHTSDDDGATWTFSVDLGSGSVGKIPDFAQFGNTAFLTRGVGTVRSSTDGETWGEAGGTQSPQPTSTLSASAGNLTGSYSYKLVSIEADGSRHPGSLASSAVQATGKKNDLAWTADADTDVVGYEVYRTTGTGLVFYYLDYVDGRTTAAYADNISDLELLESRVLEEHGDAPPSGLYYCEPHKQRMWYFRTDDNPQRGFWSDPGDPDSVYTSNNYLDFVDAESQGDVITGAVGNFEGMLAVGQERSIWTITGTGQVVGNVVDFVRSRSNASVGWVHSRAVARIPAGAKYFDQKGQEQTTDSVTLAYFSPLLDVRLFDGDNDLIISHPKRDTLANAAYAQRHKFHCVHDGKRSEVAWIFAESGSSEPDLAVVWNYRWGVWYERNWPFACAVEIETADSASVLLAGEADTTVGGYCYELWNGNDFDGANINTIWMTKVLYGKNEEGLPALEFIKRWRWMKLLFESVQGASLSLDALEGFAGDDDAATMTAALAPEANEILTADDDRLVTSDGDPLVVSQVSALFTVGLKDSTSGDYIHHEGIRLRVRDDSTGPAWSLEAMTAAYQILPGLKRRF